MVMACGEILLGLLAALLLAWLHFRFGARPLLDVGPGVGVTEADELLFRFCCEFRNNCYRSSTTTNNDNFFIGYSQITRPLLRMNYRAVK